MLSQIDAHELATVLAALRYWQKKVKPAKREDEMPDHFLEYDPLDDKMIDALCQKLNLDHPAQYDLSPGILRRVYKAVLKPDCYDVEEWYASPNPEYLNTVANFKSEADAERVAEALNRATDTLLTENGVTP